MRWIPSWASHWTSFSSVSAPFFVPTVLLDRNNSWSELLIVGWQPHTSTFYWRWTVQGSHCLAFHLRSLPLSPESFSPPRSLVLSRVPPPLRLHISLHSDGPQGFSPDSTPPHTHTCYPLSFLFPLSSRSLSSSYPCDCFLLPPK